MWSVYNDVPTIEYWFRQNNFGTPTRYGQSFVYKYYTVDRLPSAEIMDNDLNELLTYYKSIAIEQVMEQPNQLENEELSVDRVSTSNVDGFNIGSFKSFLQNSRLRFSDQLIHRFVASLLTKPFVILTGLSGSGKTKLAQAFVQWICEDKAQYRIVPVGADWTSREPVLGYPNALEQGKYVKPETGILDLLLFANSHPNKPCFLILDEMNLSHVERYFADFLSAMESGEEVFLHSFPDSEQPNTADRVPSSIKIREICLSSAR